jgi:hypothetical protein
MYTTINNVQQPKSTNTNQKKYFEALWIFLKILNTLANFHKLAFSKLVYVTILSFGEFEYFFVI